MRITIETGWWLAARPQPLVAAHVACANLATDFHNKICEKLTNTLHHAACFLRFVWRFD
jgi:hypothetical protein